MLDIEKMTQGDAQQTLQVYTWITEHLQEITSLAENTGKAGVSTQETQKEVGGNDTLSEEEALDYGEEFGFEGTDEEIIAQVMQLTPEQFEAEVAQSIADYNAIGDSIRADIARVAKAQEWFDAELERRDQRGKDTAR